MRISDWSSDVCSSDLRLLLRPGLVAARRARRPWAAAALQRARARRRRPPPGAGDEGRQRPHLARHLPGVDAPPAARKSVVDGKRVSVRVDLGGRRMNHNKTSITLKIRRTPNNV